MQITIENIEEINRLIEFSDPKLHQKLARGALQYSGRAASVAIAQEVRASYNLKAARIKQDIRKPYVNINEGWMEIRIGTKPPTALAYGARQTRQGMSVAYRRGPRSVIPKAFIAKGLPFVRSSSGSRKLNVLHGPSIGRIVAGPLGKNSKAIVDVTTNRAFEQWVKGYDRALQAEARRRSRKA
jgi:hypothetical protein